MEEEEEEEETDWRLRCIGWPLEATTTAGRQTDIGEHKHTHTQHRFE